MRLTKLGRLIAIAALASFPALGEETATLEETVGPSLHISASSHTLFSNQKDEFDPNLSATNTLRHEGNVRAQFGKFQGELTFNNRFLISSPESDTDPFAVLKQDYIQIEKKALAATFGDFQVTLGDSYQELGRGIALSLNRNAPFGLDNTLEGVSLKYRPRGTDLMAFAGRINTWDLPLAVNAVDNPLIDREMVLGGGSANLNLGESAKFGVHGFYALTRPLEKTRYDRSFKTLGSSIAVDGINGSVDFYGEANLLIATRTANAGEFELPRGTATYGSLSWTPDSWNVKIELKDYRDYHFYFRRPPTLEEDIVETLNIDDVTAVRTLVEHRIPDTKTSFLTSFMAGEDRLLETKIHHLVGGSKFQAGPTSWEARAGYRWHPEKARLIHGYLKSKIKTFPGQSLELGYRKQISDTDLDLFPTRDDRNYFDVTYNLNERFSIGGGFEYVPSNGDDVGTKFFNGNVAYKTGNFNGRAFLGKTSGGPQCAGGVCRQVPSYEGVLLDLTVSF